MKIRFIYCWLGLVLAAGLAACSPATAVPTATREQATATAAIPPTQAPTSTVENTATAEASVDACIACHTDKDQLIATADQVVEEVAESRRGWLRGRCGSVGALGKGFSKR